jgi:WLM domain/Ubiquitin family
MAAESVPEDTVAMDETSLEEESPSTTLQISFRGQTIPITLPSNSTVLTLKESLATTTSIPPSNQKLLSKGHRLQDTDTLSSLTNSKLMLIGAAPTMITEINSHKPTIRTRSPYAVKLPSTSSASGTPDFTYTFHRLVPLPHLRNADKARELLDRLVHDRGIIAIMKKYKWSVGALVEMDPAEHTYVDHKTLGLNRNRGEVIELRIRTDEYAGFRQYRCTNPFPSPTSLTSSLFSVWC